MLNPDITERIRAIFLHDGSAVTIFDFVILLGWPVTTFDAAVKWRVVTIEDPAAAVPHISHAQLVEKAREQWSEAEIAEALGDDGPRVLARTHAPASAASLICDAVRTEPVDALQVVAPLSLDEMTAAGLRPPRRVPVPRRRRRARVLAIAPPPPLPPTRRNRADGVHEATVITACAGDSGSAPHVRLRGHWLSRFGFKPDARIYITPSPGQLIITLRDPAAVTAKSDRPITPARPHASRS